MIELLSFIKKGWIGKYMEPIVPEVRLRSFLDLLGRRVDLVDDVVVGDSPLRYVASAPVVAHMSMHVFN